MTKTRRTLAVSFLGLVPACLFGAADDGATESSPTTGDTTVTTSVTDTDSPSTTVDDEGTAPGADDTSDDASDDDDESDDTSETSGDTDGSEGLPSAIAIDIAVGRQHACALTDAGAVRCWGYSDVGQLGNGAPLDDVAYRVPVLVEGLANAVAISSFGDHTCALDDGGAAWCWGANELGQLGDGTNTTIAVPVAVVGGPYTAISAGYAHTCAITQDGGAQCWGHNDYGQLGDDTIDDRNTPVDVVGLGSGVVALAAGRDHSCAVSSDGTLRCWGGDTYGELGNGEPSSASHTPVVIALGANAAIVAAGDNTTCAIGDGGAAWCWGKNADGQLGNGESGTLVQSASPTAVTGVDGGATAIAPGFGYTCAVVSGRARCWGDNYNLVLGNGEGPGFESPVPIDVTGLGSGSNDVASCVSHTCALDDAGAVRCWGTNAGGALGDGSDLDAAEPVAVISLP